MTNLQNSIFPLRLNKFISSSGYCSRRNADLLITSGKVKINNNVVKEIFFLVNINDSVSVSGIKISLKEIIEYQYIILNKPKDYIVTTKDELKRKTIFDLPGLQNYKVRIFPVGRLDRQSTGVLLITNDGNLSNKLTHPSFNIHKEYVVTLDKNLKTADFDKLLTGIYLEDGFINFDHLEFVDRMLKNKLSIIIHSGKNRIIRRMFESLGYSVLKLDRIAFSGITYDKLKRGEWRYLSQNEVNFLKSL